MMTWMYIVDYLLVGGMLVMMALGITFSASMPALGRWNKRYFTSLFTLFLLCTLTCFLALLFWENPAMATAERIIYLFEGIFISTPIFMPTFFLLHSCDENFKDSLLLKTITALLSIYYVILVAIQFTDEVYYVTPNNQFFRGPLWGIWLIPLALIMLLNVAGVIKRRKKLTKKKFIALLVYMLPMTAAIITHMFINVELLVIFGMALFAMLMFVLILQDNIEQYARHQQEIARQHASVMVLQMRPHFIYNTLMSIYSLCNQDAQKARQVTMDFTNYLRKNFNAVASESTIPFTAELEHTKAYLAVEKAQYEDMLQVEYDTPFTQLRLPPLTLQPLAENAVKHGMDPYKGPLHVFIKSEYTDEGAEITVQDDGSGFNPGDENAPHTALDNIRERLEMMCGGTLNITSSQNGTTVKIFVPHKK